MSIRLPPALAALRPLQWTKNALVFAGFLFALPDRNQDLDAAAAAMRVVAGTALFCLLSGAVYLVNDVQDRERDRAHPEKRLRPVASGALPVRAALAEALLLFAAGLAGGAFLGRAFFFCAACYVALQLAYTSLLKRVVFLDVCCIAAGFVLRICAGIAAAGVAAHAGILACTFLGALCVALCKRRSELVRLGDRAGEHRPVLRRYTRRGLGAAIALSAAASFAAYAVWTLSPAVGGKFGTDLLPVTLPFLAAGIVRYLQLVFVRGLGDRPEKLVVSDPVLLLSLAGYAAVCLCIVFRPAPFPFLTAGFALLCADFACEILLHAVRRARPGGPWASRLLFAAWFLRPLAAAGAVNIWFRLSGSLLSERRTYPFYANLWFPRRLSAGELCRTALSGEGLWPWLAIAAAAAAVAAAAAWLLRRRRDAPRCPRRRLLPALAVLYVLACLFFVSLASVPNGFFTGRGQRSSLLAAWHSSGSTMLYAVPFMHPNGKTYLRNFTEIQPKLRHTIHALSHPPVGSLFVRWIGAAAGVDVSDPASYRRAHARLRYALGQTAVSALNALLVFLLGAALFERRTGLFAALLWIVAPSASGYASFAPDMNYALFFHGALLFTWLVATTPSPRRALACAVPLGLCFAMLVLMNFSWCIATTIFAVFVLAANLRERRGWKDLLLRGVPPLAAMTAAAGWAIRHYHIDYLAIYRTSSAYVSKFYHHAGFGEKLLTFAGGQVEWLVLLGPLVCTGFVLFLREARRSGEHPVQRLFAAVVLGVFAIPVLFGPPCLKHEVARCWIWVAAVPVVLSARRWLFRESAPRCAAVVLSSAGVGLVLRLFMDLGC